MAPAPQPFLTAEWRALLMLNYEVDPALLKDRVPAGMELDTWNGRHFLSLVGFRFLGTRVLGRSIPLHRDFEEVNLRFYVRRKAGNEWRRGVVFIKELVPRRAIAWVARVFYGENYERLPMRNEVALPAVGGRGFVRYQWKQRGAWQGMAAGIAGEPVLPPRDSEEAFISEHYWGYVNRRGGSVEYQVEHSRWKIWKAIDPTLDSDAASHYEPGFRDNLGGPPTSAFIADGSPVVVHRGSRMEST